MFNNAIMRAGFCLVALVTLFAGASGSAFAKPEYMRKEGLKTCASCHVQPGGPRNFRGLYYRKFKHSFADFDNVYEAKAAGVKPDSMGADAVPTVASYPNVQVPAALDFTMKDIDGKPVKLARYLGNVILVVNVASKCGNTPQYASLEKMFEKYKAKGFTVLAFPANDFGKQEPGDEKTIKEFCEATYKVKFPLFSKVVVKGDEKVEFYKYLTSKETDEKFAGEIEWNFAKFIINRKGEIVGRIKAFTDPLKPGTIETIEKEINIPLEEKTASR